MREIREKAPSVVREKNKTFSFAFNLFSLMVASSMGSQLPIFILFLSVLYFNFFSSFYLCCIFIYLIPGFYCIYCTFLLTVSHLGHLSF